MDFFALIHANVHTHTHTPDILFSQHKELVRSLQCSRSEILKSDAYKSQEQCDTQNVSDALSAEKWMQTVALLIAVIIMP